VTPTDRGATAKVADFKKGRVPGAVRAQQLIALTEELLLEVGYEGFSIEELCRAAGVTRPVVYNHFGGRQGLVVAVHNRARAQFHDALTSAMECATDIDSAVRAAADAFFANVEANPRRWLMVFGSTTGFVGPIADELWELRMGTVDRIAALAEVLAPHLDETTRMIAAHGISGAGEGIGRWWIRNLDVPRAQVVDMFVQSAMSWLAASAQQ
jgi:AcrR family transcriptional regulator